MQQTMSEASLEVTSHYHINVQDKTQDLKELNQVTSEVCMKFNISTVNL